MGKFYRLIQYDTDFPNVPVFVDVGLDGIPFPPPSPSWSFEGTSGDCASGMFVANAATSTATTQVLISGTNDGGSDAGYMSGITVGSTIQFADAGRRVASFTTTSMATTSDGCFQIGLTNAKGALTWAGRYNITFSPAV